MTTLAPPVVKKFAEDSLESKVYAIVDEFKEYVPIPNDRCRLSYGLLKYVEGEGDAPAILVYSTKVKIEGISPEKLATMLGEKIAGLK